MHAHMHIHMPLSALYRMSVYHKNEEEEEATSKNSGSTQLTPTGTYTSHSTSYICDASARVRTYTKYTSILTSILLTFADA